MNEINSYADIVSYVERAVEEMASRPQEFPELLARAKRNRIRDQDIPGWMADELYNNSGVVGDIVGDKLSGMITRLGEDPMNTEVWNKHIAAVNALMPHVLIDPRGPATWLWNTV